MTLAQAKDNSNVEAVHENDALAITAIINEQEPMAKHASYYAAMLANFVPGPSVVSKNDSGEVTGAVLGLYDWQFKTLIVSHLVSALEGEAAKAEQAAMLKSSFATAAEQGAENVTAHLNKQEDPELAELISSTAKEFGMGSRVVFNNLAPQAPDAVALPDKKQFLRDKRANPEAITYRHPTVADARGTWSLVNHINDAEMERTNGQTGGLDVYGLSTYENLFRDTPESSMVAEYNGQIVGFASGFAMAGPDDSKGLFMWQTGSVAPGAGYGCEEALLDRIKPDYLSFTVEAANGSANKTAIKKAEHLGMSWEQPRAIENEVLGGSHDPEVMYTVAPEALMPRINEKLAL